MVGITGRPASGKTTFLHILQDFGFKTTSGDEIVHGLFSAPSPLASRIGREFGPDTVDEEGGIRRSALRKALGGSQAALERLEAIVHPAAEAALEARIAEAGAAGEEWLFVEVPLLFEAGWDRLCHMTVAVVGDEEERKRRLKARGLPDMEWELLDRRHLSQAEKARRADFTIDNSTTVQGLREEAKRFLASIGALPPTP